MTDNPLNSSPECDIIERPTLRLPIEIHKITMQDTWNAPNWSEILEQYNEEVGLEGLPKTGPNKVLYSKLEDAGLIHAFGAYCNNLLVGYITVTMTTATHYETAIMFNTESFFVLKHYRKTGAGLKLLNTAEDFAKSSGAHGLMVSARSGSSFMKVLERLDYTETNRAFFKKFANV